MKIRPIIAFIGDIGLLISSFLFILWLKPGSTLYVLEKYKESLYLFVSIWILVSFILSKYKKPYKENAIIISSLRVILTSSIVLGVLTSLMYFFRQDYYSRFVVFGTLLTLTISELIITSIYYAFLNAPLGEPVVRSVKFKFQKKKFRDRKPAKEHLINRSALNNRKNTIIDSIGNEGLCFIEKYINLESDETILSSTISAKSFHLLPSNNFNAIANLERVNDFRYINKTFESVNEVLPKGGIFIDYFESKNQRKKRILRKYPPFINYLFYTFDYIVKRIFPKFALTKGLYFFLTRGNNRVLTKAEAFGRLYSCGFELIEELETNKYTLFAVLKTKKPLYPKQPSYGPLVKLKRIGKNGKIVNVYKMRTMHPYSEFIQEYVYKKEGLNEGGKFNKDFRVTTIGRFFRIFWIDELPMILNLLKRDIKIVGVRPLSKHYFELYSKEHQERRIKYTPGLIPPYYVDNPKTLEEIIESETKYLNAYDRYPLRTDLEYFFKALYNILFKKARSA